MGTREQCQAALDHFDHAARHAERVGDQTLLARVRTYQAVARVRLGDVEQASLAASAALETAEATAISPYIAAAHACQGWVAWRRGNGVLAASLLDQARTRWRKAHPHRFPFSNLAVFPLLDLANTADDLEVAASLLGELGEGLPALPGRLAEVVQTALTATRSGDREFAGALKLVLTAARDAALL
jgi:hypothetical protein